MSKKSNLIFVFFFFLCQMLPGQSDFSGNKHTLRLSMGLGYEDGLVLLSKIPTLGIGYEYALNKRFSIASHVLSYYRNMPDSYFDKNFNGTRPTLDLIANGASGPFITEADRERIRRTGIRRLSPKKTIKSLSLPIDIGIMFYPVNRKRHKIGLNAGLSLTYETYNWWRDYYDGVTITLEDGTVYENLFLSLNTEFRNISPGASLKIIYEYYFDHFGLGFRFGNYNVFLFNPANLSVWETSLYLAFKF